MNTLIEGLRQIIGSPDFYLEGTSGYNGSWDYGAMIEYFVCALILMIVVSSIFRFLIAWVKK